MDRHNSNGRRYQGKKITTSLEEYLLERSRVNPETGCREWVLSTAGGGYGYFQWEGVWTYAHRAAYKVWKGKLRGKNVLHTCDHPICINPDHLFLGTQAKNMEDMRRKGRSRSHTPEARAKRRASINRHGMRVVRSSTLEMRLRAAGVKQHDRSTGLRRTS